MRLARLSCTDTPEMQRRDGVALPVLFRVFVFSWASALSLEIDRSDEGRYRRLR
jgi:hypothetical protein